MRRISKFFKFSTEEKAIFFRALFLLISSRFSLQFKQIKNVVGSVFTKTAARKSVRVNNISPSRIAYLLNAAGKIVPFTTCLSKALAGLILFSSLGYQTKLHIGVTRQKGNMLEAHAWLTLDGHIVIGHISNLGCYQELPSIPDNGRKE